MTFDKATQSIIMQTGFVQLNLGEMLNAGLDKGQRPAVGDISEAGLIDMEWTSDGVIIVGGGDVADGEIDLSLMLSLGSVVQTKEDGPEDAIRADVWSDTEGRIGWGRTHDMGLLTLCAERVFGALGPDYIVRAATESVLDQEILDEYGDKVYRTFFVILRDPKTAGDFSEEYFDMQRCINAIMDALKGIRAQCADAAESAYADAMESAYQNSVAARIIDGDEFDADERDAEYADEADGDEESDEAWAEHNDIVANGIGRVGIRAVRRRGHEIHAHEARELSWNAPLSSAHLGADVGDEACVEVYAGFGERLFTEDYAFVAFGADANCERVVEDDPRGYDSGYKGSSERRERNRHQAARERDARRRARQAYFAALDKATPPAFSPRYRKPEYAPDSVAARVIDSNRANHEFVHDKAA